MVLAAGLLVLLGLGAFVGGILTGTTALYWACVAACGVAAVLLVVARLRMAREASEFDRRASEVPARPEASGTGTSGARRTAPQPVVVQDTAAPRPPEPPRGPAGATAVRPPEPGSGPQPGAAPVPVEPRPEEPAAGPSEPPPAEPVIEPTHAVPLGAPAGDRHPEDGTPERRGAHEPREVPVDTGTGEPGEEDVEVTDLLLVVDLDDEVLVVDEHPRYHLAGCPFLEGREAIGLPMVEARTDGFTPCATCRPVRHLADTERDRRQAARGN
ncbi:hypothetical protein [Geodermatophilus sp. URMC 60]